MTLFKQGEFKSHSGLTLPFKIDCDALTDEDIECIAAHIASKIEFNGVIGIPSGGCRLATKLMKYIKDSNKRIKLLIVDDVLTTGSSMEEKKQKLFNRNVDIIGWVIFARGELPDWIHAMFQMESGR